MPTLAPDRTADNALVWPRRARPGVGRRHDEGESSRSDRDSSEQMFALAFTPAGEDAAATGGQP